MTILHFPSVRRESREQNVLITATYIFRSRFFRQIKLYLHHKQSLKLFIFVLSRYRDFFYFKYTHQR